MDQKEFKKEYSQYMITSSINVENLIDTILKDVRNTVRVGNTITCLDIRSLLMYAMLDSILPHISDSSQAMAIVDLTIRKVRDHLSDRGIKNVDIESLCVKPASNLDRVDISFEVQ